jgi:hypothetical protein
MALRPHISLCFAGRFACQDRAEVARREVPSASIWPCNTQPVPLRSASVDRHKEGSQTLRSDGRTLRLWLLPRRPSGLSESSLLFGVQTPSLLDCW